MKNTLNTTNVVESAAGVVLVYAAYQTGKASLRIAQASVAGVKEFRKARRTEKNDETQS